MVVLLLATAAWAQAIVLTDKITRLEGSWVRAPEKGWGGICGVPASTMMALRVTPTDITIDAGTLFCRASG